VNRLFFGSDEHEINDAEMELLPVFSQNALPVNDVWLRIPPANMRKSVCNRNPEKIYHLAIIVEGISRVALL
jgi:hypothetical protein